MDRTVATGTGYIGQYRPRSRGFTNRWQTCPDDLLLFMHHVPYTLQAALRQDGHPVHLRFALRGRRKRRRVRSRVEDRSRAASTISATQPCSHKLEYQAGHAVVWRDAVTTWFLKMSGIPDAKGRVGHYPGRIEAESMQLEGYERMDVTPWEAASGGRGVQCPASSQSCDASLRFTGQPGKYDLDVEYFDQNNGASKFRVYVGDRLLDEWLADAHLPSNKPDADSSTRRRIAAVTLHPETKFGSRGFPTAESAPRSTTSQFTYTIAANETKLRFEL